MDRLSDVLRIHSPLRTQPGQLTPQHIPFPQYLQTHCHITHASIVGVGRLLPQWKGEREKRNGCKAPVGVLNCVADSKHISSPLIFQQPCYLLREVKKLSECHLSPDLFDFISSLLSQQSVNQRSFWRNKNFYSGARERLIEKQKGNLKTLDECPT